MLAGAIHDNETQMMAWLQHGHRACLLQRGRLTVGAYLRSSVQHDCRGSRRAVVGYGEENGTQYWKLKNWGPAFGEGGYVRIGGIKCSASAALARPIGSPLPSQPGNP